MFKSILNLVLLFLMSYNLIAQDLSSGVKLIRNDRLSDAKKFFLPLTSSSAEANFYLGELYFLKDQNDSAEFFFHKGIALNDEFPLNYAGLAGVLLNSNPGEAAKNEEQAYDNTGNKEGRTFIVLAKGYAKIKKFDKAVELLNKAVSSAPKDAQAYIELGKVYFEQNNGTEAIINFEKALNYDKNNPEAMTLKSKVYILINNFNEAASLLEKAISADSSYSPAYMEYAELSYNMKNLQKAADLYTEYIKKSDPDIEKEKRLAAILYLNKDYEKAIDLSKHILAEDPGNHYSTRITAYSYFKLDNIDQSKKYFQDLFSLDSVEFLSTDYENYSAVLQKTGEDSLAVEYLARIVQMDSSRKDVYGNMSVLYFKMKNWDGVVNSLERKGDLKGQEYFDLGKAYYYKQDYAMADTAFNKLIEKVPELPIAQFWKARVQANFDPETEQGLAKPYYEKFIELTTGMPEKFNKELVEAYSYLGYFYYLKKDNISSKQNWLKVKELDPKNEQALTALKELK